MSEVRLGVDIKLTDLTMQKLMLALDMFWDQTGHPEAPLIISLEGDYLSLVAITDQDHVDAARQRKAEQESRFGYALDEMPF